MPRRLRLIVHEPEPSVSVTPPPPIETPTLADTTDDAADDGIEVDELVDDEVDELADDNDDEYYARAVAIRAELRDTPPNDVGRRLFEAYEEWAGEIRTAYQVALVDLRKEVQEAGDDHGREFGSGQRVTRYRSSMNDWVSQRYVEAQQPRFEKLERDRDEKLGIVQAWYKLLGMSFMPQSLAR
jgi:hypothetical protein